MNREEAEEYASKMTYREAVINAIRGKSIPFRKATLIKLHELLDLVESWESEGKITHGDGTSNITMKEIFAKATESHDTIEKGWWKKGKDEVNRLYDRLKK